ncbi:MAG TPA: flagellar hook-basal body complex protein, partial [bacterium]|nr:flagellar hook-basal body complex protein [bacterium]
FSLDNQGYIVDPGSGYRLTGRMADANGALQSTAAPSELQIDFNRQSLPKQTETVRAAGNFNARVGEPTSGDTVQMAQSSTNLMGLFDATGKSFGLMNGDVIRFETGYMNLGNPPQSVQNPVDLAGMDTGKGKGVILTVTSTTTVADLQAALNQFFSQAAAGIDPSLTSGLEVSFNSSGRFELANSGADSYQGLRLGVAPRNGSDTPPADANQRIGNLFINQNDPDFTKTLNVNPDSVVQTNSIRRADTTTSIDIYDSQGKTHTITVGLAKETQTPPAEGATLVSQFQDSQGRPLIPGGIVPVETEYSQPVIDTANNTAVFTARQISNVVATQGIYTFKDGGGNLIALRLSDGALSFNGGTFNVPIQADGGIDANFTAAGLDVTGDTMLNLASNNNSGGGLMGDTGFTPATTLDEMRSQIENRINAAIQQVASNLGKIDPATTGLDLNGITALSAPAGIPAIQITLTPEGSLAFSAKDGSLGVSASGDATITQNLSAAAGGEDKLGLVLDLAAKTRSVRVSTLNPLEPLANPADSGKATGFIKSADPFDPDLAKAFGVVDNSGSSTSGSSATTLPSGINDSGVQLVALSNGVYPANTSLTTEKFDGYTAFQPEVTAFRALFNQEGYGIPANYDSQPGVDLAPHVAAGIVARDGSGESFKTNTIHQPGMIRNTVNYQAVVPNDPRGLPGRTTGSLIFDSEGRFQSYGDGAGAPVITFDPDSTDPNNSGVAPISVRMNLDGITYFSGSNTAQFQSQDGRAAGNLDSVTVTKAGDIMGIFTNGDTQALGKIMLAKVTNEGGLIQDGATVFTTGPNSGERVYVEAGVEGGVINSGALELSNVDLAQEFTNLIIAQRAYQANARVITTGDQILTEVVSLKR